MAAGLAVQPVFSDNNAVPDMAIVTLRTPVTASSIRPVVLVGTNDRRPPPGSLMVTVGYGQYGTGLDAGLYSTPVAQGGAPFDGRRRVGQTRLGAYAPWPYTPQPGAFGVFAAQFRNPLSPDVPDIYRLSQRGLGSPRCRPATAPETGPAGRSLKS